MSGRGKDAPECQTCGACCTSRAWGRGEKGLSFVDLTTKRDIKRMGKLLPVLTEPNYLSPTGLSMKIRGAPESRSSRCVALFGVVGKDVSCEAYEWRPAICRDFDAGSDLCHEVRKLVLGVDR